MYRRVRATRCCEIRSQDVYFTSCWKDSALTFSRRVWYERVTYALCGWNARREATRPPGDRVLELSVRKNVVLLADEAFIGASRPHRPGLELSADVSVQFGALSLRVAQTGDEAEAHRGRRSTSAADDE